MMRFDRFTERAQDAAARAYEISQRFGHGQVDAEHMLLGVLEQPDGNASKIISACGADTTGLTRKLNEALSQMPKVTLHMTSGETKNVVFITPRTKHILDIANEEANKLGDEFIGVEHLLLGMSAEQSPPMSTLLVEANLSAAQICEKILQLRAEAAQPKTNPAQTFYHIGFSQADLGTPAPTLALLSGDPDRASMIAKTYLTDVKKLSEHRGLNSYVGRLPNGRRVVSATSGMGAPSLSIVVNELVQVGIRSIIRIGTCGSIQAHVKPGSVVISKAALCRQGAAHDIAPADYPASADPFLTVALAHAASALQVEHHIGVTASVDTFYEGQERSESANPHLMRWLKGITEEYRHLNILNYEMESGTLFKMGNVYGFAAACICGVVAQRTASENVVLEAKASAVENAIRVALHAAQAE